MFELPRGGSLSCLITRHDRKSGGMRYDCILRDPAQTVVGEGKFSAIHLHHDVPMGLWLGRNKEGKNGFAMYLVPHTTCRQWQGGEMTYPRLTCVSTSDVYRRPIPHLEKELPKPSKPSGGEPPAVIAIAIPLPESGIVNEENSE